MAQPQSPTLQSDEDVDAEVAALVEADALYALDYLCANADDWPGGQEVAECLARRRRRIAAGARSAARRAG